MGCGGFAFAEGQGSPSFPAALDPSPSALTFLIVLLFQVHSKDKKYVCKVCNRVFMSAASVGIKHGSRRHGVCADCSGRGIAGHLDHNGGEGSPDECYPGEGQYMEDPDDIKVEGDEEMGDDDDIKWKDDVGMSQDDVILDDDKDVDSPQEQDNSGENDKDFTWIS